VSAPRRARPRSSATKRAYCRRHRPVDAPDTGWQSPVQQGTVVGRSRQVTATGLDPEAVWNEPIVRCLKKIGCVIALVSDVSLDPAQAGLALQNSPADSDRSQPAVSSHAAGFRSSYSQSQVRLRVDRCMHATAFGG
jgi:hypothetical protein